MDDSLTSQSVPEFTLDLVVVDCPSALALAGFYSTVLGWQVEKGSTDEWATLVPPGGGVSVEQPDGRAALAFQQVANYVAPTWPVGTHPQQFHLDISVVDIDASERVVLAAGATVHEHQPSQDRGFRVFLDPAGHPFCLIR